MNRRFEQLQALAKAHPENPMAAYSVALEQKKTDIKGALLVFADLHTRHPDYVPAYYHYAQTLQQAGDDDTAKRIYQQGIEVAKKAGNGHAVSELEAALDLL